MSEPQDSRKLPYSLVFLSRAAVFSMAACGLGLWILRWVFSRDLGGEFAPAFYLLKNLLAFLVPALVFSLLVSLLVASAAIFVVAVFASHKVAGPLFRLQRVAGYLNRRVLVGRIHLRAGDQGKPVAACINEWLAGRKQRLALLREAEEQTELALREVEAASARRDRDGILVAVQLLKRQSELLAKLKTSTAS